jgi:hypothetical protein
MPTKAPIEDQQKQADMLAGFFADAPPLPILDRTTLERWATCPAMASMIAAGGINDSTTAANSGQEAHDVISQMISDHVESGGSLSPTDLRDSLDNAAVSSRPDVQPDVIRGVRAASWGISQYIARIHPDNILRWDGGKGDRSGQLAHDFKGIARVTAELDLLHAGPSKVVLHECDWKTGNKPWDMRMVEDSFQFQLHALLVLSNYPEVQAVEIAVWDTRRNEKTYPVFFDRRDLGKWTARVRSALGVWWQYRSNTNPPTWPAVEKCCVCPCILSCDAGGGDLKEIAADPRRGVVKLQFEEAKSDALKKLLAAYVDKTGQDIQCDDGTCFGRRKPPSKRKAPVAIYSLKGDDE